MIKKKKMDVKRVALLLRERRMTQGELARRIGKTAASVSYYMRSERLPKIEVIEDIADALGVQMDDIVEEEKPGTMVRVVLDEGAFRPERAHAVDAGLDLFSPKSLLIPAGGSGVIDTGVHVEIPRGYAGFLKSKSGLNVKYDLTGEGVVDCEYQGSVRVKLYNHGKTGYQIERGDKIIQMVILPVLLCDVEVVEKFDGTTDRGTGGFGSTGR